MIIACPRCGFSGKVPDHAALAPHQARCPKCKFRFDIGDPDVQIPEPFDRAGLHHNLARPRLDPSDSSYELDPIVDGFEGVWDVPMSEEFESEDDAVPSAMTGAPTLAARANWGGGSRASEWVLRRLRPSVWRIRLFQAWAVLFLFWAGWIVVRTVIAVSRLDDAHFFSNDLLRPIVAVVVLVSTSALLCLSVDVSRRLARLTYGPSGPATASPPPSANGHGATAGRINGVDYTHRDAPRG